MRQSALPAVVLIGGRENALSVARVLARRGIRVVAVGESGNVLSRSRYVQFWAGDGAGEWLALILTRAPRGAVVMPCCDDAIELVAQHHADLRAAGLALLEFDPAAALRALDKESTYAVAREAGVGTPRTMLVPDEAALEEALAQIPLPAALKPVHVHRYLQHFRRKLIVGHNKAELRRSWSETTRLGLEMLVTEIIPGGEQRYCSYFTYVEADGSVLVDFTKRKLRQYPRGFGAGTYHVTAWQPDVAEAGRRFFAHAGVRGLGNVEFKRDPRDGALKLIECNARFTATNDLVRKAGVDFASLAYNRSVGLPDPSFGAQRDGLWMWYPVQDALAFRDAHRAGELGVGEWARSLGHRFSFPIWSWSDPMPSLAEWSRIPAQTRRKLRAAESAPAVAEAPVPLP